MVLQRLERARIAFSSIHGTVRCDAPVNIAYCTVLIAHTCAKQSVVASRHDSVSLETYPCFAVGTQHPARVLYSGAGLARGAAAAPMHEPHTAQYCTHAWYEKVGDSNGSGTFVLEGVSLGSDCLCPLIPFPVRRIWSIQPPSVLWWSLNRRIKRMDKWGFSSPRNGFVEARSQ
jgi:hypothetical protein